jgi:Lrp/AsnC family transcriptional regulator, leucine-responsive regulatory protein
MPDHALDALDRKILDHLQQDGRMSLADLADKIGLSASPCLRRVRIMEQAGVISRYVAVLNQQAVGLPVSVFISVKLEKQKQDVLDRFAKTSRVGPRC